MKSYSIITLIKYKKISPKIINYSWGQIVHNILQLSNFFLKDLEKLIKFTESYKKHKLVYR